MRSRWPALALFALCLAPPLGAGGRPAPAGDKPGGGKLPARTFRVPYRLTNTAHIMVRVKVNSKGPFNLIVDTGAPGLYLVVEAAEKAGLPVPKQDKQEKKGKEVMKKDKKGMKKPP